MIRERSKLVMVGAFPPPVNGMAAVNAAVQYILQQEGVEPRVISLAARSLDRSLMARFDRLPRVVRGLVVLAGSRGLRGGALYMSVSGGFGQVYELLFVILARLLGMRLFLHHHSFAYLDRPRRLTGWLVRVAGADAVQVTLSPRMAERLKLLYAVGRTVVASNAVLLLRGETPEPMPRRRLGMLGFISNIAAEKGVFEYLDLLDSARDAGLPLRAKLAGPFQDLDIERKVHARLIALPDVEYVGPKYNAEKDAFYAGIDALVFPTHYANEAEPLTLHEAMSRGIPVIAYGRGVIPEIVGKDCGKVIDPSEPFVPAALMQIKVWLHKPAVFEAASRVAVQRFAETYHRNEKQWKALLSELTGKSDLHSGSQISVTEESSSQT